MCTTSARDNPIVSFKTNRTVAILTFLFFYCTSLNTSISVAAYQHHLEPQQPQQQIMRAWNCHGRNQRDMVDRLRQAGIVRTQTVYDTLCRVDRIHYAPENSSPYQDAPQGLGMGQTITAPHMHAAAMEQIYLFLERQRQQHPSEPLAILDVGCGSGYLTAAFGRLFRPFDSAATTDSSASSLPVNSQQHQLGPGAVYGIDILPDLVQRTYDNIRKADGDLLDHSVVHLQVANGWSGLPQAAPFDAIHVGASAEDFPYALAKQLKRGGVLVVPIGPQGGTQNLYRIERLDSSDTQHESSSSSSLTDETFDPTQYDVTKLLGVRYVPLVRRPTS